MTKREIILVCGTLCSGKGHYCQTMYPDYHHIVVSTIVRSLIETVIDRSALANTAHMDTQIIQKLIKEISKYDKVIVDGIRQISILHALENHFQQQIKKVIWLDVPEETRRKHFETRAHEKDKNMTFDQAVQTDKNLGIGDVEKYIRYKHHVVKY